MKRHAPATERNRAPLLSVLSDVLPPTGTVLEVASGTGQHAVFFARALPHLTWQPSDLDPDNLASIAAWREEAALPNLLPPVSLDAASAQWPVASASAVVNINMIHIAPWAAALGLFAGASRLLAPGAPLILYGPFFRAQVQTAPSNLSFDADLRGRNPAWGVRQLEDVAAAARAQGLHLESVVELPSNNCTALFRRG